MAKVDPDTNDEMEFVRYEIDRICKLLDLEKPEIIELKKVGSLSPVPKLSRDGKRIVLYKRGFDNYTWQIGQAFISVLKKRAPTWITRHPTIVLAGMELLCFPIMFVNAFLFLFGFIIQLIGALLIIALYNYAGYKACIVYKPRIQIVNKAMVQIGAWLENEANLKGTNYIISEGIVCTSLFLIFIILLPVLL
jgi:hypothetical protein